MKASESGRHRVSGHVQEHTDQQYWGFVQCYHEFDCGQRRNTKFETSRMGEPFMDKIYIIQWPSNAIDEKQKSMSTRIQYCAWEGFTQEEMHLSNEWKGQVATFREEDHSFNELWEWMENQLNSSGNFSQDSPNCRFFTPSNATWRGPTSNRKNSVMESSLCPMFNDNLQERKWGFLYFDIHQSSRICFKNVCVKGYWAFIGPGNEDKWFRRYD